MNNVSLDFDELDDRLKKLSQQPDVPDKEEKEDGLDSVLSKLAEQQQHQSILSKEAGTELTELDERLASLAEQPTIGAAPEVYEKYQNLNIFDKLKIIREARGRELAPSQEFLEKVAEERGYEPPSKPTEPQPEMEKANLFGVPIYTGKVTLPTGEVIREPLASVAAPIVAGFARGYTLNAPENLMRVVGKEEWASYAPETKAEQIAYSLSNLVGFIKSPAVKAFHLGFAKISNKLITEKAIAKATTKLGTAAGTAVDWSKGLFDNALTMATAFAAQTPVEDEFGKYVNNVRNNAINGATVATIYQTIGIVNPDFINFVSPKDAKFLSLINKKSSPLLFSLFRAGTAATADALILSDNFKDMSLVDILFNTGLALYFGFTTQYQPRQRVGISIINTIKKETEQLKKENPEASDAISEQETKVIKSINAGLEGEEKPVPKEVEMVVKEEPSTPKEKPVYNIKKIKKHYAYQTTFERPDKKKASLEKGEFLDTPTERDNFWDNQRKEAEKFTPKKENITLLDDMKRKIKLAANAIPNIHNVESKGNGSTYNLFFQNRLGSDTYSVGVFPERSMPVKIGDITPKQVEDFICRNIDLLSNPLYSIRTLNDGKKITLDIVRTFKNKDVATAVAKEYKQSDIYYLGKKDKTGKLVKKDAGISIDPTAPGYTSETLPKTPIQTRHLNQDKKNIIEVFHFSKDVGDAVGWFTPQAIGRADTGIETKSIFYRGDRNANLCPGQLPFISLYTRKASSVEPQKHYEKKLYKGEISLDDLWIAKPGEKLSSPQTIVKQGKIGVYFPEAEQVRLYTPINMVKVLDSFSDPTWKTKSGYSGETLVEHVNNVLRSTNKTIDDFTLDKSAELSEVADRATALQKVADGTATSEEAHEAYLKNAKNIEDLKNRILNMFKCPYCKQLTQPGDTCPHCGADIKTDSEAYKYYMNKLTVHNEKETKKVIDDLSGTNDPAYQEQFLYDAGLIKSKGITHEIGSYPDRGITVSLKKPRKGGITRVAISGDLLNKLPEGVSLEMLLPILPPDMPIATSGFGEKAVKLTVKDLQGIMTEKDIGLGWLTPVIHYFTKRSPALKDVYFSALDGNAALQDFIKRADKVVIPMLKKLTPKEQQDLLIYSYWQQPDIVPTLRKRFEINEPPKLNEKQIQTYNFLREEFNGWIKQVNTAREVLGLVPIEGVENYFPVMRDIAGDKQLSHMLFAEPNPVKIRIAFKNIKDPFLIERTPNIEPLKFDLISIYSTYVKKTGRYVAYAEFLAKTKMLLNPISIYVGDTLKTFSLKTEKPKIYNDLLGYQQRIAFNVIPDFIGYLQKNPDDPRFKAAAVILNKNLSAAILSWNIRSALIQPTSIVNLTPYFSTKDILWGMGAALNPKYNKLIMNISKHLPGRKYDVVQDSLKAEVPDLFGDGNALRRICSKGAKNWSNFAGQVAEIGLYPLKELDLLTAQIAGLTAYRAGTKKGLTGKELQRFIDEAIVKTQASGSILDVPKAQLGEGMKLLSLFQTFTINQMQLAYDEIIKPGIHPGQWNKQYFQKVMRIGLWTILFNMLYEDALKLRSPLPTPEKEVVKFVRGEQGIMKTGLQSIKELGEQIPYVGGMIRWSTPYKTLLPSPILEQSVDTMRTFSKIGATGFKNLKPEDWAILPKWFGIPMTSQFEKTYRRYMQGAEWWKAFLGVKPEVASGREAKQKKLQREAEIKRWKKQMKRKIGG